ncbi:MAG TPA: nuclear transport factor 2 family protein [Longimicrobiaceae bacterium]
MPPFIPARRSFAVLALAAAAACATARPAPEKVPSPAGEIEAVLQASAQAWNRGDLEGFLRPYLDSPQTTFVARDVVHGLPAIREVYTSSWWRTGTPTLNLRYHGIDVRPLGGDYALAVGHWVVTDKNTGQETRSGIFSLTMMRTPQGWRIIHDHSS